MSRLPYTNVNPTHKRKVSCWRRSWLWGGASVSSNQRPHVVWLTLTSQCFHIPRVTNFPTSLSFQLRHNGR